MASEAELLSEEIFHLLLLFLPAIQEDGHIETFDVAVTKTGRTESGIFSSTVAVSWNVRTRYINDEEVAY
jgi:hypothetical protein